MKIIQGWEGLVRALGVALIACLVAGTAQAKSDSKRERLARELLEVSGAGGSQLRDGFVLGLSMGLPGEAPELWDAMVAEFDLQEMTEFFVPVYARHFAPKDMRVAIKFFRSPAGMNFVEKGVPMLLETLTSQGSEGFAEVMTAMMEGDTGADDVVEDLKAILDGTLSPKEIRAVADFFLSPTGTRYLEEMPAIIAESTAAIQPWANERVMKFMATLGNLDIDTPLVHKIKLNDAMSDVRDIGMALMSWLTDQVVEPKSLPDEVGEERPSWTVRVPDEETSNAYLMISYQTLRELLVPAYIEEIPETDGWGHPYEFALNENVLATHVLGIRCSGRDQQFDTDAYIAGTYELEDWDQDIVWVDGYFVRYPSAGDS